MEEIGNPMIRKGSYTLEVRMPLKDLSLGEWVIGSTIEKFNFTCELLKKRISNAQCSLMTEDLNLAWMKRKTMNNFIKEFFPNTKTRGFINPIGGMDSDDRLRIDGNVDKLRKNEEQLRNTINHQTVNHRRNVQICR